MTPWTYAGAGALTAAVLTTMGSAAASVARPSMLPIPQDSTTRGRPSPAAPQRHAARPGMLGREYWATLSRAEREVFLTGFLAGIDADSAHAPLERRFRFAPAVYAAQLDDYYWWTDHAATTLIDALAAINKEMMQR